MTAVQMTERAGLWRVARPVAFGCEVGQGFLFSRPAPATELRALLSPPVVSG
jgi:EAL domain-containing protein (putative c-di-GMP-specific phosphodiesterase class I)